jgi:preprotein translocase subunit YajC
VDFLIVILFGFALIWLFIILPQRRRQSTHNKMLDTLQVGDEVLTAGGIYGFVTELAQEELAIEVADGVELRIAKRAVASVVPPDEDEEDEEGAEADADEPAAAEASAQEEGATEPTDAPAMPETTPEQRG